MLDNLCSGLNTTVIKGNCTYFSRGSSGNEIRCLSDIVIEGFLTPREGEICGSKYAIASDLRRR